MDCQTCSKRDSCVELCSQAEEFVNQDYVPRRERLASDLGIPIEEIELTQIITIEGLKWKDWVILLKKSEPLTKKQKRYLYLVYWKGWTVKKVAKKYHSLSSNISNILARAKKKVEINLRK